MQENWIGRSEGVEVAFPWLKEGKNLHLHNGPDTIYGVTYMVLAQNTRWLKSSWQSSTGREVKFIRW